eukprot:354809-Pelagomonas_calceolata.AAC.1
MVFAIVAFYFAMESSDKATTKATKDFFTLLDGGFGVKGQKESKSAAAKKKSAAVQAPVRAHKHGCK